MDQQPNSAKQLQTAALWRSCVSNLNADPKHLIPLDCTWIHFESTWFTFVQLDYTWFHLSSLFICCWSDTCIFKTHGIWLPKIFSLFLTFYHFSFFFYHFCVYHLCIQNPIRTNPSKSGYQDRCLDIYIYIYMCVYIYTYIDVYLHIVHQVGSTCLYSQYQVTMQVCVRAIRAAFDFSFNVPSWNRSYQMGWFWYFTPIWPIKFNCGDIDSWNWQVAHKRHSLWADGPKPFLSPAPSHKALE